MAEFVQGAWLWVVSSLGALALFGGILYLEQRSSTARRSLSLAALLSLGFGLTGVVVAINIDLFRAFSLDLIAIVAGAIGLYRINRANGNVGGTLLAVVGTALGGVQAFLVYTVLASLAR